MTQVKTAEFKLCTGPDGCRHHASCDSQGDHVDPSIELHNLTVKRMAAYPGENYRAALDRVRSLHPDLVRAYAGRVGGDSAPPVAPPPRASRPSGNNGASLHELSVAIMDRGICTSYSAAAAIAVQQNPELARGWAGA